MKKSLFLLPFVLLASCKPKNEKKIDVFTMRNISVKVALDFTDYLFEDINKDSLKARIEAKETFPLFVTASGCGTCDFLSLAVKDYQRLHALILPRIGLNNYLLTKVKGLPDLSDSSFVFFDKGEISYWETGITQYDDTKKFTDFFEKHGTYHSILNVSDYVLSTPLRGDFNSFSFADGIGIRNDSDTRIINFDVESAKKNKETYLFINGSREETDQVKLHDYLLEKKPTGFAYVKENLALNNLKEVSYVSETDFRFGLVSYTEKGYSFETVTL